MIVVQKFFMERAIPVQCIFNAFLLSFLRIEHDFSLELHTRIYINYDFLQNYFQSKELGQLAYYSVEYRFLSEHSAHREIKR